MIPFRRRAEPDFWATFEERWLANMRSWIDPLSWHHDKTELRHHFHRTVRAEGPRNCAYCDGLLGPESPHAIDHFYPTSAALCAALAWNNLYPVCTTCNTTKGAKWSCLLVRPDVDPVDEWFEFNELTGALVCAPDVDDRRIELRVRLTIEVLGLNSDERRAARRGRFKECLRLGGDPAWVEQFRTAGSYRFLLQRVLLALGA